MWFHASFSTILKWVVQRKNTHKKVLLCIRSTHANCSKERKNTRDSQWCSCEYFKKKNCKKKLRQTNKNWDNVSSIYAPTLQLEALLWRLGVSNWFFSRLLWFRSNVRKPSLVYSKLRAFAFRELQLSKSKINMVCLFLIFPIDLLTQQNNIDSCELWHLGEKEWVNAFGKMGRNGDVQMKEMKVTHSVTNMKA